MASAKRFRYVKLSNEQSVELHTAIVGLFVAGRDAAHDYRHLRQLADGETMAALEVDILAAIGRARDYLTTIEKVIDECQSAEKQKQEG